jgi:polyketide cyclase/dehydrase/lipid transport protein
MADRTRSSAVINAPRAAVMAVIADFPAYPEWAGAVRSADVTEPGQDGRARQVRFVLDAGVIRDSYELVYDWTDDTRVSWQLAKQTTVLSELTGSYLLTDLDTATEVTYELTVGVRIPMIGMLKRRAEKLIIDTALRGLKKRVEHSGDA